MKKTENISNKSRKQIIEAIKTFRCYLNIMILFQLLIKLFELKLYWKNKHVTWASFELGSVITRMSLKKRKRKTDIHH